MTLEEQIRARRAANARIETSRRDALQVIPFHAKLRLAAALRLLRAAKHDCKRIEDVTADVASGRIMGAIIEIEEAMRPAGKTSFTTNETPAGENDRGSEDKQESNQGDSR